MSEAEVLYRATRPGQLAERLGFRPDPLIGGWVAYDEMQRRIRLDAGLPLAARVVKTKQAWYSRHPFVVLPNGEIFGPKEDDFEQVASFYADKLAEAYRPEPKEPDRSIEAALAAFVDRLRGVTLPATIADLLADSLCEAFASYLCPEQAVHIRSVIGTCGSSDRSKENG